MRGDLPTEAWIRNRLKEHPRVKKTRHITTFQAAMELGIPYAKFCGLLLTENKRWKLAKPGPNGWQIDPEALDRLKRIGVPDGKTR